MQLVSQHLGHEHHRLVPLGRRIKLMLHCQLPRRPPSRRRPRIQPLRQPVEHHTRATEPISHGRSRQRSERPKRAHAQTVEQVDEIRRTIQYPDRKIGQKPRTATHRHNHRPLGSRRPSSQARGKDPVGNPHPDPDRTTRSSTQQRNLIAHELTQYLLATVITRRSTRIQGQQPGPHHLNPGRHLLRRQNHRLERPCLRRLVPPIQLQRRAQPLSIPQPLPPPHPRRPRSR